MKVHSILLVIFLAAACGSLNAQIAPPPGAGDKNIGDRGIKDRSIELERIDREAHKTGNGRNQQDAAPAKAANFEEIKQDFENIQRRQNEIITEYTTSKNLDHAKIANSADQLNKSSVRLESNLFPPADEPKKKKKAKDEAKDVAVEVPLPQDMKTLIVELDNTLAAFVGNSMFTNPQVVDAVANAKARADLARIIKLSAALKTESDKPAH